ncbi:MFS transporter [Pseudomonas sp. P115]|uniref:spinster family MFS transporter n=1 Tax=Pseudomonas pisciculturae TaxID=2730413 RepID=UPI0018921CF1|nr:MFS transporter [Pseudomonas pisciculturae]MBF6029821.1 MFS transporter [Pseudomonas pisciculturae]
MLFDPAPQSISAATKTRAISGEAWVALTLLTLVYALNIADRYVLSTLIEPIKQEFGLSDSAVGFLTGTSLALFYVTAGLPLGVLADRVNRKRMIALAVGVWSVMTTVCGLSGTFWHLLIARIGVGVGEAGGTPPSHSMISDYFPAKSRAFALSVVGLGASVGAWLGATGAGLLNDAYGWRAALMVFGLCGLPIAALVWAVVREPKRGQQDDAPASAAITSSSLRETLTFILNTKAVFHIMAGATALTFWGWGIVWWVPAFLSRSYALTVGQAGALMGPIHGVGGTLIMLLTVFMMLRYRNKPLSLQPRFVGWTTLLGTLSSIAVFAVHDVRFVTLALWLFIPIIYIYIGPTSGLIQNLFPPSMRAKGIAVLLFVVNIANLAVAPQLMGFCSDLLAPHLDNPQESLRYVLLAFTLTGFWAAYHYYAAGRCMNERVQPIHHKL